MSCQVKYDKCKRYSFLFDYRKHLDQSDIQRQQRNEWWPGAGVREVVE